MHDPQTTRQARLAREKALFRYTTAYEQGDIDTIADIWHEAEQDALLEQMMLDIHNVYPSEIDIDQSTLRPEQVAQTRNRLLALLNESQEDEEDEIGTLPSGPLKRGKRRGTRFLLQTIAAVLIICTLIGTAVLIFASRNTQVGSHQSHSSMNWNIITGLNPGAAQNNLSAIAALSANNVWAVGYYSNSKLSNEGGKTLIEHWNGLTWSVVNSPNSPSGSSYLNGVAAIAPNNIWAVGYALIGSVLFDAGNYGSGQILIEHWNGSSWSIVSSPKLAGISSLNAVTALSADDIWAVGEYSNASNTDEQPLIEHWNGSSWKVIQSPHVGDLYAVLNSISAISANDIWAVGIYANKTVMGNSETLLEHWNGTSWTVVRGPNSGGFLSSVTAISAHDVWAVGDIGAIGNTASGYQGTQTLVEHWNGNSWRIVKSLNPGIAANALDAVTALSAKDIYAVGYTSNNFADQVEQPFIEHWNGSSWSVVDGPTMATGLNNLNAVTWIPGSSKIWAIGDRENDAGNVPITAPNVTATILTSSFTSSVLITSCCS
jgi:hypothetical protein